MCISVQKRRTQKSRDKKSRGSVDAPPQNIVSNALSSLLLLLNATCPWKMRWSWFLQHFFHVGLNLQLIFQTGSISSWCFELTRSVSMSSVVSPPVNCFFSVSVLALIVAGIVGRCRATPSCRDYFSGLYPSQLLFIKSRLVFPFTPLPFPLFSSSPWRKNPAPNAFLGILTVSSRCIFGSLRAVEMTVFWLFVKWTLPLPPPSVPKPGNVFHLSLEWMPLE